MRIISGVAKGRILKSPKGAGKTRPTADRVRESVFNILGQTCEGLEVLDLFAGTGALGFEALSRGAINATLVEVDRQALEACRANAESLGFLANSQILPGNVEAMIPFLAGKSCAFDLVFSDPPYALKKLTEVLTALDAHQMVRKEGRVIFEHSKSESAPERVGRFRRDDQRLFGETVISFYSFT